MMNTHLSSEEMELALAGQPGAETAAHLQACERCAAEVVSMKQLLGATREQAKGAAEFYLHQPAARRSPARSVAPRWGMAFAAALLVVGGVVSPLALRHRTAAPTHAVAAGVPAAADAISDDALLSSVQNDLSTSVPEPLLPLAGTSTTATQRSSNNNQ